MNSQEHLLTCLMEECAEIIEQASRISVRAAKALRFGADEVQPDQDKTNAERLAIELVDLLAVGEKLIESGVIPRSAIAAKQAKVESFMEYARKCGALAKEAPKPKPPSEWKRGDRVRCTKTHESKFRVHTFHAGEVYTFFEWHDMQGEWAYFDNAVVVGSNGQVDCFEWVGPGEGVKNATP